MVVLWKKLWLQLRLRGSAVGVPLKLCSPASPASASGNARLPAVLMLPVLLPSAASAGAPVALPQRHWLFSSICMRINILASPRSMLATSMGSSLLVTVTQVPA